MLLLSRPVIAADPRAFGKRFDVSAAPQGSGAAGTIAADLKLFALTFAAGFVFVSVIIA
jgi:hypothetical protein